MALLISTVKDKAGSATSLEEYDKFADSNSQRTRDFSEGRINTEIILSSKPHTNGTPSHWDTILAEVDAMQLSGQCKTDIPKALIDRMKDN